MEASNEAEKEIWSYQEELYTGLSGIELPMPKYDFPEEYRNASRLTFYATYFNSIEINSSFYKIPQQKTTARWAESVPDEFRFTFKLFKEVTHARDLNFNPEHITTFMDAINGAGSKKACILIQFPPKLSSANLNQLDFLLQNIQCENPDNACDIAVEFRNRGWYVDELYSLLEERGCGLVIHDKPGCATPPESIDTRFVYLRFHGPTGNYRGSYTDDFLREQADRVTDILLQGKRVYVYFNNTAGDAFENLRAFRRFVHNET